MEKFSNYRDEATGISPFIPPRKPQIGCAEAVFQYIIGLLVLPLTLTSLTTYILFVQFLPGLNRLFLRFVVLPTIRILYLDFSYEGERRTRKALVKRARPGDLIISNFVTPLDAFVYASLNCCTFVLPTANKEFVVATPLQVMSQALNLKLATGTPVSLSRVCEEANRSGRYVVLFGEGTTSNGKGLLSLKYVNFDEIAALEQARVYTSAVKYTPKNISWPLYSTRLGYLLHMETNIFWAIVTIKVSEPVPKGEINKVGLSKSLAGAARARLIGDALDVDAKAKFCSLYSKRK